MSFQVLPPEILKYIFELLDFKERIKIERVCKEWKYLCWNYAWLDYRDLKFSWNDLILERWKNKDEIDKEIEKLNEAQSKITQQLLKEYITIHKNCYLNNSDCEYCPKNTNNGKNLGKYEMSLRINQKNSMDKHRELLSNPVIYKKPRSSRSLGVLSALIRRCAPNLEFLSIEEGINVSTRLGRYFHFLKPSLTHFSMLEPIDEWHLNQIEEHLAPSLLSLSLSLNKKKTVIDAFLSLSLKCQKLECLCINRFDSIFERSLEIGQNQCLPSTLKYLSIYYYNNINYLRELHKICPKLCFLFFQSYNYYISNDDFIIDTNSLIFCTPFFYTMDLLHLDLHSNLNSLRALKINFDLAGSDLLKIASSCPNLEHFDFVWKNSVDDLDGFVNARQLEALYSFKKLSSISFGIYIMYSYCPNESMPFHRLFCDDGLRFDDFLFQLLLNLNSITPLKNLEFIDINSLNFAKKYALKILKHLSELETFLCSLTNYSYYIDNEWMEQNEFFQSLDEILKENENKTKVFFRFMDELYYSQEPDTIFKWKRGEPFELIKAPKHRHYRDNKFGYSIVLEEILNESFGSRNAHILFNLTQIDERNRIL